MEDKVALFDMDSTLFDYERKLREDMRKLMAPEESEPDNLWDESKPHLKERMSLIKSVPGWWKNLPLYKPGWDILNEAILIGFEIEILTKGPASKSLAWAEKVDCIDMHLKGRAVPNIVGKTKHRTYGRVLVDDYPEYVMGWVERRPRGLVVMPAHPYNADCSHPNIVRYTGLNIDEVRNALQAAFDRKDGHHWRDLLS